MSSEPRTIRLRPGTLVSLSTRLDGGVSYETEDIVDEEVGTVGEREVSKWKTRKVTDDVAEHARGVEARSRVRSLITAPPCIPSPFGFGIYPADRIAELAERIVEARRVAEEYNRGAVHSTLKFTVMRGEMASNQAEAVTAVREEIQTLLGELQAAMSAGAVAGIRDVASRATAMGRLLEEGTEARTVLDRAVRESRRVATLLVKRVEEGAEAAAEIIAGANLSLISTAAMAFEDSEMGPITDAAPQGLPSVDLGMFGDLGEAYVEPEPEPGAAPEPETAATPTPTAESEDFEEEEIA